MTAFFIAILLVRSVQASITPTAPGPGQVYPMGGDCPIKWNPSAVADPAWSMFTIDLMSGTDLLQNVVVTAATGKDGNDANLREFIWPCPMVDKAAPIYFYRFTPTGPGGTPEAAQYTTRFTISRADGSIESAEHPLQPNGDPISWGTGHLQSEIKPHPMSAQAQDVKPTHRLSPHLPASLRIAATSTTLDSMPTISKQQGPEGTTEVENGDTADDEHDDISEILASMSRADALRLLPTTMENGQGSSTSTVAAPSQSIVPVVDSKANENVAAGSYANRASRCSLSSSTNSFLIVFLVVLCIEIAGRFIFY